MEGGSKQNNFKATCDNIRDKFAFIDEPLSREENDYPLAYGLLVHEHAVQVYFMLSAIYQPQNVYYVAVDGNSSSDFKTKMYLLDECFSNINVVEVAPVSWCGYEIARAVMNGLRYLAQLRHPWKYYQYLSGVDLPLKTNMEMVRILKTLNGSMNVHIAPYMHERLTPSRKIGVKPPLRLIKSSLSALISRETADAMVESELVKEHMRFLKLTWCADESLWGTIIGNPEKLPIPGSFDPNPQLYKINHARYHKFRRTSWRTMMKKSKTVEESSPATPSSEWLPNSDYIARYQAWYPNMPCRGKWTHGSCVFGVGDLPELITREELFAHKLYIDVQPAAFFCLFERVRLRAIESAETVMTN
ncbi:Protein GLY-15 a [Aphelenchoides avenae]|nr:Protein GLY-15 a [Aphelenchus avenae]